jgi:hypothetical protein
VVPDEIHPRVGNDDRGVRRGGTGDRVYIGGAWRNAEPADAHPSVPAWLQRDRGRTTQESSRPARDPETKPKSIRAKDQRARSQFHQSEREEPVISARV